MKRNPSRLNGLVVLLIIWSFAVVAAFHVVHKPFALANARAVGRSLAGLLGAATTVALGTGIGLLATSRLEFAPLQRLIWSAATGLGLLSIVALALGALGLIYPSVLWAATAGGLIVTGRSLWRAMEAAWRDPVWHPRGRYQVILAACCGLLLLTGLLWALTPPTAWDGLVYHLTGPKLYLKASSVGHPIDIPYLGFPQLVEMLFTWGMGLIGERAAAPIHWFFGALTVLILVSTAPRLFGDGSGWLAAGLLLSARTTIILFGWPYADLALVTYTTLAFLGLGHWAQTKNRTWLILSATSAGFAMSAKYTGLALGPALALTLLVLKLPERGPVIATLRSRAVEILTLGGIALLAWSPWPIKNLILTGNPTYPFFFGGVHWDAWRAHWYDRPGTGLVHTAPWRLATAPWDMTIWGLHSSAGYAATIGPLFLALLPFLLLVWGRFKRRERRWLEGALAFCGVLYGFWIWGVARSALLHQSRLLLPVFGTLALIGSAVVVQLRTLEDQKVNLSWLIKAIILVVLLLTLTGTVLDGLRAKPLRVLLGFESQDAFMKRRLGWYYAVIEHLNNQLPPDSVVQFLWEPRAFHCSVDCRPDALLDRWLHTAHVFGHDADKIAKAWHEQGVTHVLLYEWGYDTIRKGGFDPVTPSDEATLRELQADHMRRALDWDEVYVLYELTP